MTRSKAILPIFRLVNLILFCLTISQDFGQEIGKECASLGCQAYPCYEQTTHCGNRGYLIAYGEKYCRRFHSEEIYNSFDEIGKKFVNCTGKCLIESMDEYVKDHREPFDCDNLYENAFNDHVKCYLGCDFCEVCKTNKLALLNAYDLADFFSIQAMKQVWSVIRQCGLFNCFQYSNLVSTLHLLYHRLKYLPFYIFEHFAF